MSNLASTFKVNKYKTQFRNRCKLCGRPRFFIGYFKLCRICVRKLFAAGRIPGGTKSSW